MNTQKRTSILLPTIVFIGLAIAYAVLVIAAKAIADPFDQTVMISTGGAILGAGLVFFLVRISASQDKQA